MKGSQAKKRMKFWRAANSTMKDTIIAELRKVRDEHAARFNHDLDAIGEDLRKKEKAASRKLVNRKPRRFVAK